MRKRYIIALLAVLTAAVSCRREEPVLPPEEEQHGDSVQNAIAGFYLLNEGNMGSNKATLDYYDYTTATYRRNIYAEANPNVPKELGDVGNDLQIYGSRLYAVINCSNKIEVMDARTAARIGQVDIPNCRYLAFDGPYAYVSSYAGPVSLDASHAQIGYVARIDTATLQVTATCNVGYQPDGLAIADGKLFVANSGGYMSPGYDSTVSVIDLTSFQELTRISVDINLHHVRADRHGQLWVSSRGDYYDHPSRLFCIDRQTLTVTDTIPFAVSDLDIVGDSLYFFGSEFSYITMRDEQTFGVVDIRTHEVLSSALITDATRDSLTHPYCIKVNPLTHELLLTDAKDYVTPGTLRCYGPDGRQKWAVRTGDIPAHIAFYTK